jgi:hypothetical protein
VAGHRAQCLPIITRLDPHMTMQTDHADTELAAVLTAALADAGRTLDLTLSEAVAVADALRAIVAALPAPTPRDVSLSTSLAEVAALIERRAGIA